jgi:predicted nucleic acid-binding protein
MVTTAWIVTELANALAKGPNRRSFADLLEDLQTDERVRIIPADSGLFESGLRLYLSRMDKDWSLTDCISFVVMEQMGLTNALTGDRHFEQAGFSVLFE